MRPVAGDPGEEEAEQVQQNGIHKDTENVAVLDEPGSRPMDCDNERRDAHVSAESNTHALSGAESHQRRHNLHQRSSLKDGTSGSQDSTKSPPVPLPPCMANFDTCQFLRNGPRVPPVTTDSLKELDLLLIKNNLSLRIDVNYDHDLHFMPISGRRGEEKRIEARSYWQCLELELKVHRHNSLGSCQACNEPDKTTRADFSPRLPSMFHHLKSLILLLVPDDDHDRVEETLDVDFLVQKLQNGVLDVCSLSVWLKALLTSHCAPIRDEWAEEMATIITSAAENGDMHSLVAGLETLFSFLECMRLDVANHQIRTYRVPLIEDGVAFQTDYFEARLKQGKLSVDGSKKWFQKLCGSNDNLPRQWFEDLRSQAEETGRRLVKGRDIFVCALTEHCTSTDSRLPITLKHDMARLTLIQQELHDEIHLRICENEYKSIIINLLKSTGHSPRRRLQKPPPFSTSRISDLLDSDSDTEIFETVDIWRAHIDSIALDVAQQAFRAVDRDDSLITADLFSHVRRVLLKAFDTEYAEQTQTARLTHKLQRMVLAQTALFDPLSPLEISEQQKVYQQNRASTAAGGNGSNGDHCRRAAPDLEDIARRLAHLAVIHWRVWRTLAYLDHEFCREHDVDPEDCVSEMEMDLDMVLDLNLNLDSDDGRGSGSTGRDSFSSVESIFR